MTSATRIISRMDPTPRIAPTNNTFTSITGSTLGRPKPYKTAPRSPARTPLHEALDAPQDDHRPAQTRPGTPSAPARSAHPCGPSSPSQQASSYSSCTTPDFFEKPRPRKPGTASSTARREPARTLGFGSVRTGSDHDGGRCVAPTERTAWAPAQIGDKRSGSLSWVATPRGTHSSMPRSRAPRRDPSRRSVPENPDAARARDAPRRADPDSYQAYVVEPSSR